LEYFKWTSSFEKLPCQHFINLNTQIRCMAHVHLYNDLPGIVGLMVQWQKTAKPLNELAEVLLQNNNGLLAAERELIAAHVSRLNTCTFCSNTHLNASLAHFGEPARFIDVTKDNVTEGLKVRPVVQALLSIAGKVQQDGKKVEESDIEAARLLGATDDMIHDTVLIAAAFCMFNRYVDGLGTFAPQGVERYAQAGKRLAEEGYLQSIPVN
jgi:uncharacterized peroxidase-related enzyme